MAVERVGLSFVIGAALSNTFRSSMRSADTSLSNIGAGIRSLSRERLDINRQINLNPEKAEKFKTRLSEINKELSKLRAARRINVIFESNMQEMKSQMASLGKIAAGAAVGGGLMSIPVRTAIEFEQSMLNVKSVINGITEEKFKALNDEAKRLGAATSFSASEAAEGMKYLAMAGFNTNQIIEAMPGLLDMAKAGVIDLGRASDISSNILSAFGISANEMGRVADTLTMAFTTSNTTLESLGYTMKYVGPIARAAGMSLEEAAAMAGLLGNVGIQGEMAGTQLRAMLNRLAAPVGPAQEKLKELGITVKDSTGNLRPMIELLAEMDSKTANMGNADRLAAFKTIFGEEAVSGLSELINQAGAGGIAKYLDIVKNNTGKASQVASIQMSGVKGAMDELSSAAEGLSITFANLFLPAIKSIANGMKSLTNTLNSFIETHPTLTRGVVYAVAGFTAYVAVVKTLMIAKSALAVGTTLLASRTLLLNGVVTTATFVTKAVTVAQWALNAALIANPIGLVVAGVAALIGIGIALYKNWDKVTAFFTSAWEKIKSAVSAGFEYIASFGKAIYNFYAGIWSKIIEVILKPMEMIKGGVAKVKSWLFGEEEDDPEFNNPTKYKPITSPVLNTMPVQNTPNISGYYAKGGLVQQHSINNSLNAPITYAPNITIQGNASREDVENALMNKQDFEKMMKEYNHNNARLSYGGSY